MGIKGWYLADGNNVDSSYTDFTVMNEEKPVKKKAARKPAGRKAAVKSRKKKKKSAAGKVALCVFGAIAIALGSSIGTWYYLTDVEGEENLREDNFIEVSLKTMNADLFAGDDTEETKNLSDKTEKKRSSSSSAAAASAYEIAEDIMSDLWGDNDVDTAYQIFDWVHSNISYQTMTSELSYEEAALRGFTRRSGDCYVYFSCAKMLLDCAGIPNMMVERYPVITNGHFWNLVQLDGEWYHCDATVFRDHPGMYFMCTDDEIADDHHSFDGSLYPERASGYGNYYDSYADDYYGPYVDDYYEDYYDDYYDEDYSDSYWEDDYYWGDYVDYYADDWG